jgi:hypothetical protein
MAIGWGHGQQGLRQPCGDLTIPPKATFSLCQVGSEIGNLGNDRILDCVSKPHAAMYISLNIEMATSG